MIDLYQFPISHYCEKVRWALEYKQIQYRKINLLPGLHVRKTRKLASKTAVPIIVDDGHVVHNSSQIISYLDQKFLQNQLTPEDEALRESALDWERFADKEIGSHVRFLYFHILLDYPDIVIPFFSHGGPMNLAVQI